MEVEENDSLDGNRNNAHRRSFQHRKNSYRTLLNKIEDIEEKEDLGLQTATSVGDILKEINVLEKECTIEQRVDQTDETLLDCMVLSSSSSILVKCINAVDISSTLYDPSEFCDYLSNQLKDEDEEFKCTDLLKLLPTARTVIPVIHPYGYVYGSYDLAKIPEPKQKKGVTAGKPKEKFTKKEPEKVSTLDKEEQGIDEIVKGLYNVLKEEYVRNEGQPINYYDYVIDTDFSCTVQNMFYCSFLVRDGKAAIDLDGRDPTIKPISKKELKQFRDGGGLNSQIITTITMEDWENFKREGLLQRHKRLAKVKKI